MEQEHDKRLLIVGAGDLGQAVAEFVFESSDYRKIAFVDDHPTQQKQKDFPILGSVSSLKDFYADYKYAVAAIGNNQMRRQIRFKLQEIGYILPILIHPSAVISPSVVIEPGVIIRAGVCISRGVTIKTGCLINMGVLIDHGCEIKEDTHIPMGCIVRNNVVVPSMSAFNPGQVIE